MAVYVLVKCIVCGEKEKIYAGEIEPGDHPMCKKCFNPMVPVKAVADKESHGRPQ